MSLFFLSLFLSKIHWPTAIIRNFPQDLVPLVSLRSIECFLFQLTFCVSYWSILKTCWPCWSCAGNVFKICWKENESEKAETLLKIIIICRKYFENVLKTYWKHVELMKTQKKGGGLLDVWFVLFHCVERSVAVFLLLPCYRSKSAGRWNNQELADGNDGRCLSDQDVRYQTYPPISDAMSFISIHRHIGRSNAVCL